MRVRKLPVRFRVGLSFASEQFEIVKAIARAVEERLGRGTVFFYPDFQSMLAGVDGDLRLQKIYTANCDLIVVCISAQYGRKSWTQTEWEAIRALLMQLRQSGPAATARILPIRVGEGDVEGINFNTIAPDVRRLPAAEAAALIVERLESIAAPVSGEAVKSGRFIFLAECTADREDPTQPVSRQKIKALIEGLGWTVLPAQEYPSDQYQAMLAADMARSSAFVQLLGRYKWKPEDLDRIQNDAAERQQLKRIVFRSADIDLAQVEPPAHREYLTRPDVIVSGFDDFLVYLNSELERLAATFSSSAHQDAGSDRPLVRVMVRSSDPDALWARAFKWIDGQGDILSHQIAPDESLVAKHAVEPCQGFLVLCDAFAHDAGTASLRSDLEQCRLLQIREKDSARRPPVVLVYWPPPDPSWAKLIRSMPLKLTRDAVTQSDDGVPKVISSFFDEVRRVPRG